MQWLFPMGSGGSWVTGPSELVGESGSRVLSLLPHPLEAGHATFSPVPKGWARVEPVWEGLALPGPSLSVLSWVFPTSRPAGEGGGAPGGGGGGPPWLSQGPLV